MPSAPPRTARPTPAPPAPVPASYPQGSLPPQHQLVEPPQRQFTPPSPARRLLVIFAVAVIVSTIGIMIVLLT
jgi:hypothetical protein